MALIHQLISKEKGRASSADIGARYIRCIFKRSPAFLSIPSSSSVIVDDPRSISRRPSEELARSASRYLAAYTQRDTRVCVLATRVPTAQRRNGSIPNLS